MLVRGPVRVVDRVADAVSLHQRLPEDGHVLECHVGEEGQAVGGEAVKGVSEGQVAGLVELGRGPRARVLRKGASWKNLDGVHRPPRNLCAQRLHAGDRLVQEGVHPWDGQMGDAAEVWWYKVIVVLADVLDHSRADGLGVLVCDLVCVQELAVVAPVCCQEDGRLAVPAARAHLDASRIRASPGAVLEGRLDVPVADAEGLVHRQKGVPEVGQQDALRRGGGGGCRAGEHVAPLLVHQADLRSCVQQQGHRVAGGEGGHRLRDPDRALPRDGEPHRHGEDAGVGPRGDCLRLATTLDLEVDDRDNRSGFVVFADLRVVHLTRKNLGAVHGPARVPVVIAPLVQNSQRLRDLQALGQVVARRGERLLVGPKASRRVVQDGGDLVLGGHRRLHRRRLCRLLQALAGLHRGPRHDEPHGENQLRPRDAGERLGRRLALAQGLESVYALGVALPLGEVLLLVDPL